MRRPHQAAYTPESRQYRPLATPSADQPAGVGSSVYWRLSLGLRTGAAICANKHGWLVLAVRSKPARGEATPARRLSSHAAFDTDG